GTPKYTLSERERVSFRRTIALIYWTRYTHTPQILFTPQESIVAQHNPSLAPRMSPVHETVAAFAPATIANLGVGFDILGMALETPGDVVRATFREQPGATLDSVSG